MGHDSRRGGEAGTRALTFRQLIVIVILSFAAAAALVWAATAGIGAGFANGS